MTANQQDHDQSVIWLNPSVLRWAREWRGRTLEEAAKRVRKPRERLEAWEAGEAVPTVREARILARFYDRAFLEFFLPNPPAVAGPKQIPDYRVRPRRSSSQPTQDLVLIQLWAEAQRANALDLFDLTGEPVPEFPRELKLSIEADPEHTAELARAALNFRIEDQIEMTKKEANTLPGLLRSAIEHVGVLALRRTELEDHGVSGICLAEFPLPVIVFASESPAAQAFTLMHELAHVISQESGITGPRTRESRAPVEEWCDRFAGAFLMPRSEVEKLLGDAPVRPRRQITDDRLGEISSHFRTSRHATLIRLVHLGYVEQDFYWVHKKPQFDAEEAAYEAGGRAKYWGSRLRSSLGDLYTGLVLEAWSQGRLSNHNAAEFMGTKNVQHLEDIRDNFRQS